MKVFKVNKTIWFINLAAMYLIKLLKNHEAYVRFGVFVRFVGRNTVSAKLAAKHTSRRSYSVFFSALVPE